MLEKEGGRRRGKKPGGVSQWGKLFKGGGGKKRPGRKPGLNFGNWACGKWRDFELS